MFLWLKHCNTNLYLLYIVLAPHCCKLLSVTYCSSFPLLLKQSTMNLDFKQYKLVISQFGSQKPKISLPGPEPRWVGRAAVPLQTLREESVPCLLEATMSLGLWPLLPSSKPAGQPLSSLASASIVTSSLTQLPTHSSFPPIKILWLHWTHPDHPEYLPHLKFLDLITSAKSPLPCKVFTYART